MRLGLWSVTFAACVLACKGVQPTPEPAVETRRETVTSLALEPGAPEPGNAGTAVPAPSAPSPHAAASGPAPTPPATAPKADNQTQVSPELRRLVVSASIKDKEPVPTAVLKVNDPVIAFLELANSTDASTYVQVVFQHESGREVGFVQLDVPATKSRWRTWAQTAMIKQAGKWTAIVRDASGSELGQHGFFVNPT